MLPSVNLLPDRLSFLPDFGSFGLDNMITPNPFCLPLR
jgi:hypothetical protein